MSFPWFSSSKNNSISKVPSQIRDARHSNPVHHTSQYDENQPTSINTRYERNTRNVYKNSKHHNNNNRNNSKSRPTNIRAKSISYNTESIGNKLKNIGQRASLHIFNPTRSKTKNTKASSSSQYNSIKQNLKDLSPSKIFSKGFRDSSPKRARHTSNRSDQSKKSDFEVIGRNSESSTDNKLDNNDVDKQSQKSFQGHQYNKASRINSLKSSIKDRTARGVSLSKNKKQRSETENSICDNPKGTERRPSTTEGKTNLTYHRPQRGTINSLRSTINKDNSNNNGGGGNRVSIKDHRPSYNTTNKMRVLINDYNRDYNNLSYKDNHTNHHSLTRRSSKGILKSDASNNNTPEPANIVGKGSLYQTNSIGPTGAFRKSQNSVRTSLKDRVNSYSPQNMNSTNPYSINRKSRGSASPGHNRASSIHSKSRGPVSGFRKSLMQQGQRGSYNNNHRNSALSRIAHGSSADRYPSNFGDYPSMNFGDRQASKASIMSSIASLMQLTRSANLSNRTGGKGGTSGIKMLDNLTQTLSHGSKSYSESVDNLNSFDPYQEMTYDETGVPEDAMFTIYGDDTIDHLGYLTAGLHNSDNHYLGNEDLFLSNVKKFINRKGEEILKSVPKMDESIKRNITLPTKLRGRSRKNKKEQIFDRFKNKSCKSEGNGTIMPNNHHPKYISFMEQFEPELKKITKICSQERENRASAMNNTNNSNKINSNLKPIFDNNLHNYEAQKNKAQKQNSENDMLTSLILDDTMGDRDYEPANDTMFKTDPNTPVLDHRITQVVSCSSQGNPNEVASGGFKVDPTRHSGVSSGGQTQSKILQDLCDDFHVIGKTYTSSGAQTLENSPKGSSKKLQQQTFHNYREQSPVKKKLNSPDMNLRYQRQSPFKEMLNSVNQQTHFGIPSLQYDKSEKMFQSREQLKAASTDKSMQNIPNFTSDTDLGFSTESILNPFHAQNKIIKENRNIAKTPSRLPMSRARTLTREISVPPCANFGKMGNISRLKNLTTDGSEASLATTNFMSLEQSGHSRKTLNTKTDNETRTNDTTKEESKEFLLSNSEFTGKPEREAPSPQVVEKQPKIKSNEQKEVNSTEKMLERIRAEIRTNIGHKGVNSRPSSSTPNSFYTPKLEKRSKNYQVPRYKSHRGQFRKTHKNRTLSDDVNAQKDNNNQINNNSNMKSPLSVSSTSRSRTPGRSKTLNPRSSSQRANKQSPGKKIYRVPSLSKGDKMTDRDNSSIVSSITPRKLSFTRSNRKPRKTRSFVSTKSNIFPSRPPNHRDNNNFGASSIAGFGDLPENDTISALPTGLSHLSLNKWNSQFYRVEDDMTSKFSQDLCSVTLMMSTGMRESILKEIMHTNSLRPISKHITGDEIAESALLYCFG